MSTLSPRENPPVTAATVVAAIMAVVTAFDIGHLTSEQTAAVAGVLAIVAAIVAQRFTLPRSDVAGGDH